VSVEKKVAAEILETLRLWGVRTFADFAALPVAGVSERLGKRESNFSNSLPAKLSDICTSNNPHLFLQTRSSSNTPSASSSRSHSFSRDCCTNSAPL
jgi:hypothetical protein